MVAFLRLLVAANSAEASQDDSSACWLARTVKQRLGPLHLTAKYISYRAISPMQCFRLDSDPAAVSCLPFTSRYMFCRFPSVSTGS